MSPSNTHRVAAAVRAAVHDARIGDGPVLVTSDYSSREFLPSILLSLQDQGIEFRLRSAYDAEQFGAWRNHGRHPDAVTRLRLDRDRERAGNERLVADFDRTPAVIDEERFDRIETRIVEWLRAPGPRRMNPRVPGVDEADMHRIEATLEGLRTTHGGDGGALVDAAEFVSFVAAWGAVSGEPLFDVPGLQPDELQRWGIEKNRRMSGRLYLYSGPLD